VFYVTHLFDLANSLYQEQSQTGLFLRAERKPDGGRTFRVLLGEPLPTSHGQETAAAHTAGNGAGSRGGPSQSHPVQSTKPAHAVRQHKPEQAVVAPPVRNQKSVVPATVEAEKPAAGAGQDAQALPAEATE